MLDWEHVPEGLILPVQAQPRARRNGITGIHERRLKVAVTQAPEKGKANKALVKVLAAELGIKRSQIQLLRGETAFQKRFLLQDLSLDELRSRLCKRLQETGNR